MGTKRLIVIVVTGIMVCFTMMSCAARKNVMAQGKSVTAVIEYDVLGQKVLQVTIKETGAVSKPAELRQGMPAPLMGKSITHADVLRILSRYQSHECTCVGSMCVGHCTDP